MPIFKSIHSRNEVFGPILSALDTSAMTHVADAHPMPSKGLGRPAVSDGLYDGYKDANVLDGDLYARYDVKRGLRNADGSGVLVGLTTISNVHGYTKENGVITIGTYPQSRVTDSQLTDALTAAVGMPAMIHAPSS